MKNWEFRCKGCDAQLTADITLADGLVECPYCQRKNPVPRKETSSEALRYLHDGTAALDVCKFEDAFTYFQKAAELDNNEPEAYFGMALAQYKVQYLKDEVNNCLQPICHEISEKVFTEDKNYKKALELATVEQKKVYRRKGGEIDDIRDEFCALEKSGLSYDCFLCVKVTEEDGTHTEDYNRANDIYYHLKDKGYKPFYSEREMKGRTGSAYEALILYALYTSECMLLVCSNEDYLQTKWVKNEYTRFINLMQEGGKERDALTFVFAGKPIEKLSNGKKIQGIDLSKPDAYSLIAEYVEKHTPEARKKREAEEQKRKEASEEQTRIIEEQRRLMEEQRKELEKLQAARQAQPASNMSAEELRALMQKAIEDDRETKTQAEKERKAEIAKRKFYTVDEKVCIGCGLCAKECPHGAIMQGSYVARGHKFASYHINDNLCDRCGDCRTVCPQNAITGAYVSLPSDHKNEVSVKEFLSSEEEKRLREREAARVGRDQCLAQSEFDRNRTILTKYKGQGGKVYIPRGIQAIGNGAFYNCSNLTEIVFCGSLATIGSSAFFRCVNLTHVAISDNLTTICDNAFDGCSNMEKVDFSHSLTSIGNYAFRNCKKLKEVIIPNSVTSIGDSAFKGCTALEKLIIPDSVESIGKGLIDGCDNLKEVTLPKRYSQFQLQEGVNADPAAVLEAFRLKIEDEDRIRREEEAVRRNYLAQFQMKDGCLVKYVGKGGKVIIPEEITEIGYGAFSDCSNVHEVIIPKSVTRIARRAFANCEELESIEIPDSVKEVGNEAFYNCQNLKKAVLPNSVTTISDSTFSMCVKLSEIVIPNSVKAIGNSAFHSCAFVELHIPNSVESINQWAFCDCMELQKLVIPKSVTSIRDNAFSHCKKLQRVTIPACYKKRLKDIFSNTFLIIKKKMFEFID